MCINLLTISGSSSIIEYLKNGFTLDKLYPCPDIYQNEEYKENWMSENWGIKKDIDNVNIEIEGENILYIKFHSEEYPPIECITNYIKSHMDNNISAYLEYLDLQERYYGDASWERGELVYDTTQGYEKIIDIPEEIRKLWYIPDLTDKIEYNQPDIESESDED